MFVKPTLNGFENVLMLPSRDPSFFASGALSFDGAALTGTPQSCRTDRSPSP
jgi:hypothetical protein